MIWNSKFVLLFLPLNVHKHYEMAIASSPSDQPMREFHCQPFIAHIPNGMI